MSDFIAQKADPKIACVGASIGIFDPGSAASDILGDVRGGQLFAYLFRRFGYSNSGWDEHKELTYYLLTTPMDTVFLSVCPYMAGDYRCAYSDRTRHMFGYCISQEIEEQFYTIPASKHRESELYQHVSKALEDAIRDLIRPVFIRDIAINCYGRVPDEELDVLPRETERCNEAGYGIPADFFADMDRYDKFLDAMVKLGQGDFGNGMQWAIDQAVTQERKELENLLNAAQKDNL